MNPHRTIVVHDRSSNFHRLRREGPSHARKEGVKQSQKASGREELHNGRKSYGKGNENNPGLLPKPAWEMSLKSKAKKPTVTENKKKG